MGAHTKLSIVSGAMGEFLLVRVRISGKCVVMNRITRSAVKWEWILKGHSGNYTVLPN